jgi:cell division protein FtsQ
VDLRLRNGARVRWGDDSRAERKATVLLALMRQKGAFYDVSAPDLPVVKG